METLETKGRTVSLIIYCVSLMVIHYNFVDTNLLPSTNSIWFYSGLAGVLFGTRLLNPHFVPPADAATNSLFSLIGILGAYAALTSVNTPPTFIQNVIISTSVTFCSIGLIFSVIVILARKRRGDIELRKWIKFCEYTARSIGRPEVSYTLVILVAVWLFHSQSTVQTTSILSLWFVIVTLKPVEGISRLYFTLAGIVSEKWQPETIGEISAFQYPGLVLIREVKNRTVKLGTLLLITDSIGPAWIGLALNHIGRDEGLLLRTFCFPIPANFNAVIAQYLLGMGKDIAIEISIPAPLIEKIPATHPASILNNTHLICGIVDEGTSINQLQFEVLTNIDMSEGQLVCVRQNKNDVLYQITEAITREDILKEKNKYGYARARARKIGSWDDKKHKFINVEWLPNMNSPVIRQEVENFQIRPDAVGHFPKTDKFVGINISDAVTHNTAILGILGVGKSYLAIELVERMIAEDIKVICLDLTNQYEQLLAPFLDPKRNQQTIDALKKQEGRGQPAPLEFDGGTMKAFMKAVDKEIEDFSSIEDDRKLLIINPSAFNVWRQDGYFKKAETSMSQVTPCGITALISNAALKASTKQGMTDTARICLVYEEAHSLVPEWNSVAEKGDSNATAVTARAILQGRKFGLGCLLITQRTANVTKTILNQCNSIFALRTFDDTGKDFLSNYLGSDYADTLPNLHDRHAIFFGKASTCNNPVLLRLNDNKLFTDTFRKVHPPVLPQPMDENDELQLESDKSPHYPRSNPVTETFKVDDDFEP